MIMVAVLMIVVIVVVTVLVIVVLMTVMLVTVVVMMVMMVVRPALGALGCADLFGAYLALILKLERNVADAELCELFPHSPLDRAVL